MHITHYHEADTPLFRSLSSLPEPEAIRIMEGLFEDSEYGKRFRDPESYIQNRKATEEWVRTQFIKKNCAPQDMHPVYFVFGDSDWIVRNGPKNKKTAALSIPIDFLTHDDVSFTYPDSMVSRWFSTNRPGEIKHHDYFGKVFTMNEIVKIVSTKGTPEKDWEYKLPESIAPYIEAQVWNKDKILEYVKMNGLYSS